MQEVSEQEQADMAIKLHENVRQLIRDEIKAALEDYQFMGQLGSFQLGEAIIRGGVFRSSVFRDAVKSVIVQQMQRY